MGRVRGRGELALWIGTPILAFVVVYNVAGALPAPECGEGGGATGGEMTFFWILVAAAMATGVIAAVARLSALGRRGLLGGWHAFGALAIILAAGVVVLVWGWTPLAAVLVVAGGALTAGSLLALLVAWGLGRSVDQVGVLLPVYLLGAAILCFPAVAVLVAISQSGLAC